ncbi:DUF3152 domain-containing protein [Streptomyces sp. NPDC051907]|uniref:DUF3152 domain-containing protein n=1 Tax=Streptomyces sp. NPDC051907 TaxID=3155284 RepID=UPI00342F73E8
MGKRASTQRAAGRRRRTGGPSRRRPPTRLLLIGLALAVLALSGGAALAFWQGVESSTDAARHKTRPTPSPTSQGRAIVTPDPEPEPEQEPEVEPKPEPSPSKRRNAPDVPQSGKGTFVTADASGAVTGKGTLRRYRVQVEDGIDLSAKDAAAEIQQILAHPRGWAAHGRGSFQLASASQKADFVIRIATPDTADALCRKQGLDTGGELNCETVDGVVVNLRRWMLGSPTFAGAPAEYRHLIINHEVGHEIGLRAHLGCGGAGKLAPVMMQQIKGLNGCVSNAWPYDEDGTYITGPTL